MLSDSLFEENPKALQPYREFDMINRHILVFSGFISQKLGKTKLELEGIIYYSLDGGLEFVFEGNGERMGLAFIKANRTLSIITSNGLTGKCISPSYTSLSNGNTIYRGIVQQLFSSMRQCSCWHWSYLNMTKFHGELVTRVYENHRTISTDRLSFLCKDGTKIITENTDNKNNPKSNNQYVITHHCKLIPANGKTIDFNSAKKYIIAFSHFISFVVGKYHSPILIEGLNKKEQHYPYYYSGYDTSRYNVISWLPYPKDIDIVLITHSHIDHVKGLKVFCKKYNPRVYISEIILNEANLLDMNYTQLESLGSINDIKIIDDDQHPLIAITETIKNAQQKRAQEEDN